jgi:hypothetical protein
MSMSRVKCIAGLLLFVLASAAQAQSDRNYWDPRDRWDAQNRRDPRGLLDPRDRRDVQDRRDQTRRDPLDQRDLRDRGDPRDLRDRTRERSGPRDTLIPLGERRVDLNVDRDIIRVGQPEAWFLRRTFRALHFFIDDNDIYFDTVTVKYLNGFVGPTQSIGRIIRRGGRHVLSFEVPVSYLGEIEMVYKANDENSRGPALVRVYGEAIRGDSQPGRDEWVKLDCDQVAILDTTPHVIRVGRREGRFMAIRLHARHADIFAWDLKVHYSAGTSEEIDFRPFVEANGYTRALDLIGNQRSIDRIEFTSRSTYRPLDIVLGVKVRRPDVCVEGLQHLPAELLRAPGTPAGSGAQ